MTTNCSCCLCFFQVLLCIFFIPSTVTLKPVTSGLSLNAASYQLLFILIAGQRRLLKTLKKGGANNEVHINILQKRSVYAFEKDIPNVFMILGETNGECKP